MADLLEKETFERLLKSNIEYKQAYFKGMFNETCPSFDDIFEEYYAAGQRLKEFVTDTSKILNDAFVADEKVLFRRCARCNVRYRPWYISIRYIK